MKRMRVVLGICAMAAAAAAGTALGQSAGVAGGAGAPNEQSPQSAQAAQAAMGMHGPLNPQAFAGAPSTGHHDGPAPPIGLIMQQNGGSMLRASLMVPSDPDRAKMNNVSFFAVPPPQPKTLKKHDLITIVIHEDSQFSSQGDTDLERSADYDAQLQAFILLNLKKMQLSGVQPTTVPELHLTGSRDFKGTGTVDRTDTLSGRITAEVLDVKPNNTLVLQARKKIKTDEEEQEFIMTGICRAEDVAADNTLLSTQVYDLEFQKNHKGAVRDATKRGWLPRLLDFVNPF